MKSDIPIVKSLNTYYLELLLEHGFNERSNGRNPGYSGFKSLIERLFKNAPLNWGHFGYFSLNSRFFLGMLADYNHTKRNIPHGIYRLDPYWNASPISLNGANPRYKREIETLMSSTKNATIVTKNTEVTKKLCEELEDKVITLVQFPIPHLRVNYGGKKYHDGNVNQFLRILTGNYQKLA